jgi:hypothetical protein
LFIRLLCPDIHNGKLSAWKRHRYSLARTIALSSWGLLRPLTHSLVAPVINHGIPPLNAEGIMTATFSFVSRLHNTTYIPRPRLNIIFPLTSLCYKWQLSKTFPRPNFMRICCLQVRPVVCKPLDFIALIIFGDMHNLRAPVS